METIFVSSTCYDLIDLRSEIEAELREMHLKPLLSDLPISEFDIVTDQNSIENCLLNVRRSDIFILILSRRYGPSLKVAGYPDVSATHLEYIEARKHGKPIYVYVRDRLEADFVIWKKNRGKKVKLSWIEEKDINIFELLNEYRKLNKKEGYSNWFWTFSNSLELKKRLRSDLREQCGKGVLLHLTKHGRMPYLLPEVEKWTIDIQKGEIIINFNIVNGGYTTGLQPNLHLAWDGGTSSSCLSSLLPGKGHRLKTIITPSEKAKTKKCILVEANCQYVTPEGYLISDYSEAELSWDSSQKGLIVPFFNFVSKNYLGSNHIKLNTVIA